jgi:ATP phosphoribosyltransferase regulatory subunit
MAIPKLPAGVQDVLPEESRCLDLIAERLRRKFDENGYESVASATLEYFSAYSEIRNALPEERLFKLTDHNGRLLVLRPDATLAISRIAATKLSQGQNRLCYFTSKFDLQGGGEISNREILQAGVERLGESGAFSDAQTIAFAIECLKTAGLGDFVIDLGHVGYFKGVLEECGLSSEDGELLRRQINRKDGENAERILKKAGASAAAVNSVLALPALFGGAEVLERARDLTQNARAQSAIAHLQEVDSLLSRMGYANYVSYDLGAVRRLSYYSGIVFSGLVRGLGAPVLSGGRYDDLADDFGKHIPAVGFALGLKRILIALERQGNLPARTRLDAVIVCEKGAEEVGYREALRLADAGKRVKLLASYYGEADLSQMEAKERFKATRKGVEKL